jgi:DegV family protein with EDD domain
MTIQVIADSSCDLPQHIIDEYNIKVMPLVVLIEENQYYDKESLQPNELYSLMREGKVPKTAGVPPQYMKDVFHKASEDNKTCIYITLSSELSGTYQTAVLTKDQLQDEGITLDLTIIDSKSASLGLGLTVFKAAQLAQAGKSKSEILQTIEHSLHTIKHIFTVDDLEYLFRGGRITKTAAFVGSLLKIKPILHMEDGKLFPLEKIRGSKKVLSRIVELTGEHGDQLKNQMIGISHSDDLERANQLKEMIESKFGVKNIIISSIGCSIGAHVGPGTLAIFFHVE